MNGKQLIVPDDGSDKYELYRFVRRLAVVSGGYLFGGCVRDEISQIVPQDIDIRSDRHKQTEQIEDKIDHLLQKSATHSFKKEIVISYTYLKPFRRLVHRWQEREYKLPGYAEFMDKDDHLAATCDQNYNEKREELRDQYSHFLGTRERRQKLLDKQRNIGQQIESKTQNYDKLSHVEKNRLIEETHAEIWAEFPEIVNIHGFRKPTFEDLQEHPDIFSEIEPMDRAIRFTIWHREHPELTYHLDVVQFASFKMGGRINYDYDVNSLFYQGDGTLGTVAWVPYDKTLEYLEMCKKHRQDQQVKIQEIIQHIRDKKCVPSPYEETYPHRQEKMLKKGFEIIDL